MMDCDLFRLLIQKYYDGELDPAEKARFEAHRAECPKCRAAGNDFLEVFETLQGIDRFQPSEQFNSRVMAKVDTGKYRENVLRKFVRDINWKWNAIPAWARIAGSLTAAFVFFMYVFRPVYLEIVEAARKTVLFLLSAAVLLRRAGDLYERVINYLNSDPGFIVAARVLAGKVVQFLREIPAGFYVAGALIAVLIIYMLLKFARTSWRKGESHVSVI